jgi:3-hexulose-6-phosphate synthase/6-phospho-3-hexuloisomerase
MAAASESTIKECIEAGKNYGIDICVDLLGVKNSIEFAKLCEDWGANYICIHLPIDDQMRGLDPLKELKLLRPVVKIPIAVAGGINSETATDAVNEGADIIIVGGAITKSANAEEATRTIIKAMVEKIKIPTTLYKRIDESNLMDCFRKVSTPNISDAMHRSGDIFGLMPIQIKTKLVGKAFTVRTYPGDWAKPVEAIDLATEGDVIVIDAGGVPPAVWGELASESCIQKGIAGVVIDGAIRDVDVIRELGFQAFAKFITPTAGEPKGFGEIGIPVKISGVLVSPGDWIIGDDNGLVIVPKLKAVEIANRSMDVLEKENRIREEIRRKSTLAKVSELAKWEKQIVEGFKE